jgi:hypothetical protein
MIRILSLILSFLLCAPLGAQQPTLTDADSLLAVRRDSIDRLAAAEDFITVSLLTATPGSEPYSIYGHSALRLQSPSNGLDITYTFTMDFNYGGMLAFLRGRGMAGFVYATTQEIIDIYRQEGRGVREVQLNLPPRAEQALWRNLDTELIQRRMRVYNYLSNNCASMTELAVQGALTSEHIVYNDLDSLLHYKAGDARASVVRLAEQQFPWYQALWNITAGEFEDNPADKFYARLMPANLEAAWLHAEIEDSLGQRRPMTVGRPHMLLEPSVVQKPFPVTPIHVGSALLVLAVLATLCQVGGRLRRLVAAVDGVLVAIHLVVALWFCYLALFSGLVATTWNWLYVVFNPLYEVLWLFLRRRPSLRRLHLLAAIACFGLLACSAWVPALQYGRYLVLLLAAFIVRLATSYYLLVRSGDAAPSHSR